MVGPACSQCIRKKFRSACIASRWHCIGASLRLAPCVLQLGLTAGRGAPEDQFVMGSKQATAVP